MKTETEVIGRLLANTRRPKRALSIFEIAEDIDWLSSHSGQLTRSSFSIEHFSQYVKSVSAGT